MATCVTCGDELHRERAAKYDYCPKPACRERNARPRTIASVGVNKASEQFVVLDEETRRDLESGRFKKAPDARATAPRRAGRAPVRGTGSADAPVLVPRSTPSSRPRWSEAQQNLALTYRAMGHTPQQIAAKLGVSRYLVTQILLAATSRGKR
jgi:hypothetical protein